MPVCLSACLPGQYSAERHFLFRIAASAVACAAAGVFWGPAHQGGIGGGRASLIHWQAAGSLKKCFFNLPAAAIKKELEVCILQLMRFGIS